MSSRSLSKKNPKSVRSTSCLANFETEKRLEGEGADFKKTEQNGSR